MEEVKKGEEVEKAKEEKAKVEKEVKEKESAMCGCGSGVMNSAVLKAQLAVLPRLQEELAKRDAEVSDLRGAQQGLQTKYGDLEQKYASCLSEGTKLKEECEELNLQKEQIEHQMDVLQDELSMMHQEYVELMEE